MAEVQANFRAFNGPVSLKPEREPGEHCGSENFRAFNGPVSLKHR